MTVAGRTREWRVGSMEVLVAGLVVLALSAGTLRAFVVGRPDLATAATVFCGVFVQAADARLARLHLRGPAAAKAATYPEETWLRVEGTVVPEPPDEYGTLVPTLTVSTVTPIPAPKNSYGY